LTEQDRDKDAERLAFVAAELSRAGAAVIAAPTVANDLHRQITRETVIHSGGAGNFFLIHVATPLEHCEKTDRKGVYAKARQGDIKGIPGVDGQFERPSRPDLTVDLSTQSAPEVVHSEYFPLHVIRLKSLNGA
jgi:sulfate adenylyltransferase